MHAPTKFSASAVLAAASVLLVWATTAAMAGSFVLADSPSAPVGSVVAYAGTTASLPGNWRICNGEELSRHDFRELFNRLGTAWGPGNSTTTFNIPDLRGRFVRGVDDGTMRDKGPRGPIKGGALSPTEVGTLELDALQTHIHAATQSAADGGHNHPVQIQRTSISGSNGSRDNDQGGNNFNADPNLGSISASIPANTGAHTHAFVISPPTDMPGQPSVRTSTETRPENAAVYWICKVR